MKTLVFCLFLLIPIQLLAKTNLKGRVNDGDGHPLDAVTITLSQNGKVISNQLSNDGNFSFTNLNMQGYQLTASSVGFQPLSREFKLPKDSLLLIMKSDNKNLKEVVIAARTPTIERKVDRVVFNVANSIMASGGNVYDALKRAPGVRATDDGTVTANNKSVTVYMNDRPIRLSGEDLATYLQSLPAGNISKIEVMTVPGAKYDAEGGAVINIISKKNNADGLNMNIGGGYIQGRKSSFNGNTLFNYRKNKLNIYGVYSYQDRNIRGYSASYDIFTTPGTFSYWDKQRTTDQNTKSNNYSLGVDYNLTDKQVFGFFLTGNNNMGLTENVALTNVYNNHRLSADSILQTNSYKNSEADRYSFNLNYKVKLDTNGQILNIDVDYVPFRNLNTQNLNNLSLLPVGTFASPPTNFHTPASQKITIWSAKADYDYRLGRNLTLESGLKYTGITTENIVDFFITNNAQPVRDPLRSDFFRYTENTAALYTSIAGDLGKWSLKAGVRAEDTRTEGFSIALDSLNKNKYLRLFPTAYVTYKASADHVFKLNYSRRIDRPDYGQLNPARTYTTPYSYGNGNPFLSPTLTDNLEATYVFKEQYTLGVTYTQINDRVFDVTVQDNNEKTYHDTQENLGKIRNTGIVLMAANHPFTWWEINSFLIGTFQRQTQLYLNGALQQTFNYNGNVNNSFIINKTAALNAELTGSYNSAFHLGPLNFAKTYDVSAGLSKALFQNQGTIRFTAADIFYGNPYRININYLDQQNGAYLRSDTRNFTLSFSYKLGKSIAAARKRSTASEEEKNRAN